MQFEENSKKNINSSRKVEVDIWSRVFEWDIKSKVWILTIMIMTEMDEDLCRPIFCAGFYRVGNCKKVFLERSIIT